MTPPAFDNLINKVKAGTKQCADQMGRAAKVAKLRMDILAQSGEKSRLLQNIGEKTYQLYAGTKGLDGLLERLAHDFTMIQRIEARLAEIEVEIADMQAALAGSAVTDATEVRDVTESVEHATSSQDKHSDEQNT